MTLQHLGKALRVLDEHGRVSLTNVGLLIVLFKLAHVTELHVPELGALLLSLAAYNGKKIIEHFKARAEADGASAEQLGQLAAVSADVKKLMERARTEDTGRAITNALGGKR